MVPLTGDDPPCARPTRGPPWGAPGLQTRQVRDQGLWLSCPYEGSVDVWIDRSEPVADAREDRRRCRALANQLIAEYAGAVPPRRVMATVFRAHHALTRHLELSAAARMSLCESSARRALTDQIAGDQSTAAPEARRAGMGNGRFR
jgi:hypothetical protein